MAVAVFIAFWIVLGLSVFLIALRGGPRGVRETYHRQSRTANRATVLVMTIVYLGIGIAVPAVVLARNDNHDRQGPGGRQLSADAQRGRELFGKFCIQCHTLKGANAVGKVGPDLDDLRPPAALVLDAIQNGRHRGNGTMPADLVQGQDAKDVAAFVAAVAGR